MDTNFNLRRLIFGDRVLGEANLRMVEIARSHGGKFLTVFLILCKSLEVLLMPMQAVHEIHRPE